MLLRNVDNFYEYIRNWFTVNINVNWLITYINIIHSGKMAKNRYLRKI